MKVMSGKTQIYRKRPEKVAIVRISDEERHSNMLGKSQRDALLEQFCGCCGQEHKFPDLLDCYYLCAACQNSLREPVNLRERWHGIFVSQKLEICFATYGHPTEPVARDVTDIVEGRVNELWHRDRLQYRKTENLNEMFGCDPCEGENKQLKVRYRMLGLHAMLQLDVMSNGQLASNFMLIAPKTRLLVINRATYGHPKGQSQQGRMSIDVQEVIQGIVDAGMSGGSYLTISHMAPVKRTFGDPCPGYPKDLRISFEICGRSGEIIEDELRGFLKKRVHIEFAPTIKPLIFVSSATYGITPGGRRVRIEQVSNLLREIGSIEHRKANGHMPRHYEIDLLRRKGKLEKDLKGLREADISFVDIRDKMQRLCDASGPQILLHRDRFDPNASFGNPSPGVPKMLEVMLESPGHDAERETDSLEMTASGHPRNFITNKSAKIIIPVDDVEGGHGRGISKGKMEESLHFHTDMAAPVIHISRATYGILDDASRVVDVTLEVQSMVEGRKLHIGTDVDLTKAFSKDPCPGMRKQLRIAYVTRGFVGAVRVRERNDLFVTTIELGYPAVPGEDS